MKGSPAAMLVTKNQQQNATPAEQIEKLTKRKNGVSKNRMHVGAYDLFIILPAISVIVPHSKAALEWSSFTHFMV